MELFVLRHDERRRQKLEGARESEDGKLETKNEW